MIEIKQCARLRRFAPVEQGLYKAYFCDTHRVSAGDWRPKAGRERERERVGPANLVAPNYFENKHE